MLSRLLESLSENGITNYLIATNAHCVDAVNNNLDQLGVRANLKIDPGNGFRTVPLLFKDDFYSRFMFVCGHHPVSSRHVASMLRMAAVTSSVISAYDNSKYTMDKVQRYRLIEPVKVPARKEKIDISNENIPKRHFYVRNPYIISSSISEKAIADNYRYTFSSYIVDSSQINADVGAVIADCPPEYDYPSEYQLIEQYLSKQTQL